MSWNLILLLASIETVSWAASHAFSSHMPSLLRNRIVNEQSSSRQHIRIKRKDYVSQTISTEVVISPSSMKFNRFSVSCALSADSALTCQQSVSSQRSPRLTRLPFPTRRRYGAIKRVLHQTAFAHCSRVHGQWSSMRRRVSRQRLGATLTQTSGQR